MDDPGIRAKWRNERVRPNTPNACATLAHPSSSQSHGVETVDPLNEAYQPTPTEDSTLAPAHVKESVVIPEISANGYEVHSYRPPVWVPAETIPGPTNLHAEAQSVQSHAGPTVAQPKLDAQTGKEDSLEDSKNTLRPSMGDRHHSVRERMSPHLQFMAGPMLTYHTVKDSIWHGAAMIVTADAGSVYEPMPSLSLSWTSSQTTSGNGQNGHSIETGVDGVNAGMEKLDVNGNGYAATPQGSNGRQDRKIVGENIFVYHGPQGSFTFTRFQIRIPITQTVSTRIDYRVNGGVELNFWIPGLGENLRWAAHSCNGFSGGVKTEDFFNPDKFDNGYDPLWADMLEKHAEKPIHCMVGGGDQIYCDSLMFEPEMQDWLECGTPEKRKDFPLSNDIMFCIDRYYFSHYCKIFRTGKFGLANASIPMVNCLDDHDLIDGFGSYPDDLQQAPVFKHIGSRGYFWYLLFQLFIVDDFDGTSLDKPHTMASMIIGGDGPWIPSPGHSMLIYLGPEVYMLLLDCRAERKKDVVCSKLTYDRVFNAIKQLPNQVKHLVFQLGIPIAYPRMNFVEKVLESKLNPLVKLSKVGLVPGFVNKFNEEAELLDDCNDHWTASSRKHERNWLVEQCQRISVEQRLRISFVSGDVHCASATTFHTVPHHKHDPIPAEQDPKWMLQVVTSAIVNTPPPAMVGAMISRLGGKRHKTLHANTDETMVPLFELDTDESKMKHPQIMAKRNWTIVDYIHEDSSLRFDIRVEIKQGDGETKGYPISAPAPSWT
ncbi:hypothetical protein [Phaffia rhodozyma]|uniref:PhoD-like phosphatase domain-containing protein n=1 Tax=Phaffia rhodozyma TaxID=264483 RepID=A0A0F7SJW1_PHARH|nr:hypothetical protein [Phaffia rhodozyma]